MPNFPLAKLVSVLSAFRTGRRGTVAVLAAIMLVPLLLATGAAVDFSRVEIVKRSLQSVVDGAALAGASTLAQSTDTTNAVNVATDYFNKGAASLNAVAIVGSATVSVPNSVTVTVSTTASLSYGFTSLFGGTLSIPVTATAEGPAYTLQVTNTGGFSSSAYDSDSVYFYTVAASGALPTTTSSMTLLFTNDPAVDSNYVADNHAPKAISIGANDSVGFALVNKTGGITSYSPNGYGARQGTMHYFYSSMISPSSGAYPSQGTFYTGTATTGYFGISGCNKKAIITTLASHTTASCYPHPCATLSNKVVLENNLLVDGACSTYAAAVRTCLQLQQNPVSYTWNDMGGGTDDYDYNDANYTVSCVPNSDSDATQPNGVILVH